MIRPSYNLAEAQPGGAPAPEMPDRAAGGEPVSLFEEMVKLFTVLNPPMSEGAGRVVQFVSAQPGEGTSTIAREFARVATLHSQQHVLLLDLDPQDGGQYRWFLDASAGDRALAPSEPVDIGLDPNPLWRVASDGQVSELPTLSRGPLMSFHRIGASRLVISRFRTEALREGQVAQVSNSPDFWEQLRERVNFTVVDSPPTSRSADGLAVSGMPDAVVLVLEAEATRTPVIADLRDMLQARGAPLAGIVFNKRRYYIPQSIYRLL